MNIEEIKYDEKGLVAAIVQDIATKEVLTLAYMNKESLEKSLETGETWFYSRSRARSFGIKVLQAAIRKKFMKSNMIVIKMHCLFW